MKTNKWVAGWMVAGILVLLTPTVLAAGDICNQGCVKNSECGGETPYLCKRSWWPDKCVPEGYDFGACGQPEEGKGYCYECDQGCVSNEAECGSDGYLCKKSWAMDKCVEQGYDFGCCGSTEEKEEVTVLTVNIRNNEPKCSDEYPVKWEVKRRGENQFIDYTEDCYENSDEGTYKDTPISIGVGESKTLTCRSKFIPHYDTGPHKARISWCTYSNVTSYGSPPDSGKYCMVNVTKNGDNVHELNSDVLVYTIGERLTEIRRGVRGSATLGPYDPLYEVGHTEPSLVPAQDIKPLRECLSKCPECAALFNLKTGINGENYKSSRCPASAFMEGAYTGAVFLMSGAAQGKGVNPAEEIEHHKTYYKESKIKIRKPKVGTVKAPGLKVPKEVGEEMYSKGYIGENVEDRYADELIQLEKKYGYADLDDFPVADSASHMSDALDRNPVVQEEFIDFVEERAHYKLAQAGVSPSQAENIFDRDTASTMVKTFYEKGIINYPDIDNQIKADYLSVTGKSKIPPRINKLGSETLVEVMVNDVKLFNGKKLKNFIGENSFNKKPDHYIKVQYEKAPLGVRGASVNDWVALNKETTFMSDTALYHEIGHVIGEEVTGGNMPSGVTKEIPATKADIEFFQKMDKTHPNHYYDYMGHLTRLYYHENSAYEAATAFWEYHKKERGIDIFKNKLDDFKKMTNPSKTLQTTAKWNGIEGGLKKSLEEGGETLAKNLQFDNAKGKYVWVGKGMRGTKTAMRVAGKSLLVGLSIVGVLGDVDTALGGAMGFYKSEQNPLTQQVVSIDYVNRSGSRGTGCGTMVVSQNSEKHMLPDTFTLEKGVLKQIHLGSKKGDTIQKQDVEQLRLEGIGIELNPTYMECSEGKNPECSESEKELSISGGQQIFSTDDTGYVCTKPIEEEKGCGN